LISSTLWLITIAAQAQGKSINLLAQEALQLRVTSKKM